MSTGYRFAGKVIGELRDDGTLVQQRTEQHFLRAVQGFALAFVVLHDPNVERIETHYLGKTYTVTTAFWLERGVPWRNGNERQVALPLHDVTDRNANQDRLEGMG